MSCIAAIRTHKWTDEEDRLLAALRPAFGEDVVVVFHDRATGTEPPLPVIDINAQWVLRTGLALVPDYGWRCGDYFYYALRAARPEFDHYWLIEPDVHFTSEPSEFYKKFDDVDLDGLGYQLGPFTDDIRFTRGLPGMRHHRAVFALTRFSGRALDRLLELRKNLALQPLSIRDYPNDEVFAFTHLAAQPDMRLGRLEDFAGDWFEDVQFASDPDLLLDVVQRDAQRAKVWHPVRGREAYKSALGRRLAGNLGLLMRIRQAIDIMSDDDIAEVAQIAAERIKNSMTDLRSRRALRSQRRAKHR